MPARRRSIEQHPDAEVGKIRGPGELDHQEGVGGRGEDRRQPERRREGVHDASRGDAEHRQDAGAPPLREAAADDVEGVLPGRQVQEKATEDEEREILRSEHVQLRGIRSTRWPDVATRQVDVKCGAGRF